MRRFWRRLMYVQIRLHSEPHHMTYKRVPRWKVRGYCRGGWTVWDG